MEESFPPIQNQTPPQAPVSPLPPVPTTPTPLPPEPPNSSKRRVILIVFLLALLILGVGGFYLYQNMQNGNIENQSGESSPSPETENKIEGWETYTESSGSFSFQYPSNWSLVDENKSMTARTIYVTKTSMGASLWQGSIKSQYPEAEFSVTTLDGIEASRIDYPSRNNAIAVHFRDTKGSTFIIEAYISTTEDELTVQKNEFSQILGTFSFAENNTPTPTATSTQTSQPTPTSSQSPRTYTNTVCNCSITYPGQFKTQTEADGAGSGESKPDARSFFLYNSASEEPYLERYLSIDIFGLPPDYGAEWNRVGVTLGGKPAIKLTAANSDFVVYTVYLDKTGESLIIMAANQSEKQALVNQILGTLTFNN